MRGWMGLFAVLAFVVGCPSVGGGPDAGFIAAEGEGEGGGEGEGEVAEGEGECPVTPVFGIEVGVTDGVTSIPVCDATVTITQGAFNETLVAQGVAPDCAYVGASDRAGTYTLQATHPDYAPSTFPVPITVAPDDCGHVVNRRIEMGSLEP